MSKSTKTKLVPIKVDHRTADGLTAWRDMGINVTTAIIGCIRYGLSIENPLRPSYEREELVQLGLRLPLDLVEGVDDLAKQWSASRAEVIDVLIQVAIVDGMAGAKVPLTVFLPTPWTGRR